ncbi:hypothetical protein [Burkholderia vietnamiensis]|nr:hypothetical protein [Burkholderia vietnamiensis]
MANLEIITPTSSIDVEPHDLPEGAQNMAGSCGGPMKRGFLLSVKRNQSQAASDGRDAPRRPPRVHAAGFLSDLARDYWRVIKGFP